MKDLSSFEFEIYLEALRNLAGFPTLFTNPDQIEKAMNWCHFYFDQHLSGYEVYRDQGRNLIACPKVIDHNKDITYLSAHIDTVDADITEWDEPFSPFSLYEDEKEMVARGISDCKAGVALELFLIKLLYLNKISVSNLVFTLTFKEEGAGEKTSIEIGKELGRRLPISWKDTYLLVLENTITVSNPPILGYYTTERGNFVIRVSDFLDQLQQLLLHLHGWNPVSIHPAINILSNKKTEIFTQKGGHVCSIARENNLLTELILHSNNSDVLLAGDTTGFSVIPSKIYELKADYSLSSPVIHQLTLSNRSFDTLEDVQSQLKGIVYEEVKDFSISQGMNFDKRFSKHKLASFLKFQNSKSLHLEKTHNTGLSDATIITNSMEKQFRDRFYPIVIGPDARSQRNIAVPRLTHGKNETFDKGSGRSAVACILSVLEFLGGVHR